MLPVLVLVPLALIAQFYFVENARERGLAFTHDSGSREKNYIIEAKGAGLAVADVNGDGWDDIYFVNGAPLHGGSVPPAPRHRLFLNRQDGTFRDATEESGLGDTGYGAGAYFADVDNDGDLDCYLTQFGPNRLYRNEGTGRFAPVENAGGAQSAAWSTGAAFGDVNGDGFLDLYVGNYAQFSFTLADRLGKFGSYYGHLVFIGPASFQPAEDNLFINNGNGTFRDETRARGINSFQAGRAFTAHFSDLDDDGDLDIYVANDANYNHLYENRGGGFFADDSLLSGAALSEDGSAQSGMGVAIRDTDGDQDRDIVVTNFEGEYNILYRNEGGLRFTDAAYATGAGEGSIPKLCFGVLLEDFDNDSWPDLHAACGHVYPVADTIPNLEGYAQPGLMYHNAGQGIFKRVTESSGPGLRLKGISRGSAAADFDRDGDVDIVISNLDGRPFFLENRGSSGNWAEVALQDERGMPAYGAQITIEAGGREQTAELYSSDSFLSQSSAVLHFGLGKAETVDAISVRWPDGSRNESKALPANQRIVLRKKKRQP